MFVQEVKYRVTVQEKRPPLQIPDIIRAIFVFFNESDLLNARATCKIWRQLALDRLIVLSEKQAQFWRTVAQKLVDIEELPGLAVPNNIYLDFDGLVYRTKSHLRLKVASAATQEKFQLSLRHSHFQNATPLLCSIRTLKIGKIALLSLSQTPEKPLVAYNLDTQSVVWLGPPNESYVFGGGVSLSNRLAEATSPYFLTHVPSKRKCHFYSLYDMKAPLFTLDHAAAKFINFNREGDFFVIIEEIKREKVSHVLYLRNGDHFNIYSQLSVLAFDPDQSLAILQNLKEENKAQPVELVRRAVSLEGEKSLDLQRLPIPAADQYSAQMKGSYAAILAKGKSHTLFLFKDLSLDPIKLIDNYQIHSFGLYEDYLVLMTRMPDKMVVMDLKSLRVRWSMPLSVESILDREALTIICQSSQGVVAINLVTKKITTLSTSPGKSSYSSPVLCTKTSNKQVGNGELLFYSRPH